MLVVEGRLEEVMEFGEGSARAGEWVSRVLGGRFGVWELKVVGDGCGKG